MRRLVPPVASGPYVARLSSAIAVAIALAFTTISAQIPGRNVNMVAGQDWPGGDPFLQRQNEPSIAASTRNPLHLLAGSNDYRTIDLPGLPDEDEDETGDAWLGLYKSFDGGQRWTSGLLPGYPQDQSPEGLASPLKGYAAGADPVVRAGISGLIFYSGLVFDREENGKSAIFVSRFIDQNNQEAGDPFNYLGTSLVAKTDGSDGRFLDKPWMAVDLPRPGAKAQCEIALPPRFNKHGKQIGKRTQKLEAGNLYVAYTSITGDGPTLRAEIYLQISEDCGRSWSAPRLISDPKDRVNQGATIAVDPSDGDVFVTWRRFGLQAGESDAIMVYRLPSTGRARNAAAARQFKGKAWGRNREVFEHRQRTLPSAAAELDQFDQNTTEFRFRSNAYPTATVDQSGRLYVAWSERGFAQLRPDGTEGDARIVIVTSTNGEQFSAPLVVDDEGQPGHQLMPTIAYAGGRLMLVYYDVRDTRAQNFGTFVSDAGLATRQTMDIRAAMGQPGATPTFEPSVKVSDYMMGFRSATGPLEQLQVNPPNLPMFRQGTVPFIGDYIDVTAAPVFVVGSDGKWRYNTATSATPPVFHAVWTDNRDVRPPVNGDWTQYTPPLSPALGPTSLVDPTRAPPMCVPGNAGSRNQNVYSSRITGGLVVGSPGNAKQLSPTLQRAFVVFAQNTTNQTRSFRMVITAQPQGGRASFSQFPLPPYSASSPPPVTSVDMRVPPRSMAVRSVYATSTNPDAQVPVSVFEIAAPGAPGPLSGGLSSNTVLNPDVENPDVENPDVENPDVENPDVENAEVYNPDVENPDVENPDVENPDVENPDVENPDVENVVVANPDIDNINIGNPDVENPDVENPDVENPDVENPDVENGAIADITWSVKNTGNTTAAFNVNLFLAQASVPQGIQTQLVIYKTYRTPVTVPNGCELRFETRNVLVTNIPSPNFLSPAGGGVADPNDPSDKNPTLWLAPNEVGRITLRIVDNDTTNNVFIRNANGELVSIDPVFNPEENDVTPGISSQAVDSDDAEAGVTDPPIVTPTGSNLFFLQEPTTTNVNTTMTPPVRVRVIDNAGASLPGVAVSLSLNVPGVVLAGGSALTDETGMATFGAVQINTPGENYVLTASVGGAVPATAQSRPFAVTVPIVGADLSVTQSAPQAVINTNSTLLLTVANNGPATATDVVLTNTLPSALAFVGVTDDSCVHNPDLRTVTCPVGTLEPGASREFGIVVVPRAAIPMLTIASVTGSQPDDITANNTSEEITFVSAYATCSSPTFRGPFVSALDTASAGTLATADFNEDGYPDVMFAENDGNFVLLLSNGEGGYLEPQYFPENNPAAAISADFNSDGHADVAVINSNLGQPGMLSEFGAALGDGHGNFSSDAEDVFLPLASAFTIETADFNHDTHPDVVVSSNSTADNTVVVLLGVGDGTFGAPISVPAGPTPGNLVLGDFNLDGNVDIAVNNTGTPTVSLMFGDGEGGFAAPQTTTLAANSQRLRQLNDINGDGAPDLGVTTGPAGAASSLVLLVNDGAGGFLPGTEVIGPRGVGFTTTGDLNGDGRLDIAAIMFQENSLLILNGDGAGGFTESASYLTGTTQNHFAITDLNLDGRPDIIGTIRGGYYTLINSCTGNEGLTADLQSTITGPEAATVGDELTFTATIVNGGADTATDARATVVVPAGMTFLSSSIDCVESFGTVQCQLPNIEPEGLESFTINARAFAAGLRVSRVMATASEADPDGSNNVGRVETTVAPGPFTFVVTSTADAGPGTLRQVIGDANLNVGSPNNIHFAIDGAGPFVIAPRSALPAIAVPVVIDGTTQPGYAGSPLIELTGINVPAANGLNVQGGNSTVRGLSITRWATNGINLTVNGNNVVEGNYVGLTPAGLVAGNNNNGVNVLSPNNRIGGTTLAARNVIAGNTNNNVNVSAAVAAGAITTTGSGSVVLGNYIGTNAAGSAAATAIAGNSGVRVSVPNVVVGSAAAPNVISGHGASGNGNGIVASAVTQGVGSTVVLASPTNLVVQSNLIGTNADGTASVPNIFGVQLSAGSGRIGGANAGEGNVISGNLGNGINLGIQTTGGTAAALVATSSNYFIEGNIIGLNAAGTAPVANLSVGVTVSTANNTIGGLTPGAGNVISGNGTSGISMFANTSVTPPISATATTIIGNRIGTNPAGTAAIANGTSGISLNNASNNVIGGMVPGARNLISGNGTGAVFGAGIGISGTSAGNQIVGNYIGTDVTGSSALGNNSAGISIGTGTSGTTIGGAAAGAGNVISGNGRNGQFAPGISINSSSGNIVQGNVIGANAAGTAALPNANGGIEVNNSVATTIGGSEPGERNVISGNGSATGQPGNPGEGIAIFGTSSGTVVRGNLIGTDISGAIALPNSGDGIFSNTSGVNNVIGDAVSGAALPGSANIIAFNTGHGINFGGGNGRLTIRRNSIFSNDQLGINLGGGAVNTNDNLDADAGPNGLQNYPVLSDAQSDGTVTGSLSSAPNVAYVIDFYATPGCDGSGFGEGLRHLGAVSITADASGNATFTTTVGATAAGEVITATATDSSGNTSEFSACVPVEGDAEAGPAERVSFLVQPSSSAAGVAIVPPIEVAIQDADGNTVTTAANLVTIALADNPGGGTLSGTVARAAVNGIATFDDLSIDAVAAGYTLIASSGELTANTSQPFSIAPSPFIVTTVDDSGAGSLRGALLAANATAGTQVISFNIPGAGPETPAVIAVASALPAITESVIIDGTTQPGWDGQPLIQVRGPSSTTGWVGFHLNASSITLRGLSITNFGSGILGFQTFSGHLIEQNIIGSTRANASGAGNSVGLDWRASNSLIRQNVISGNSGDGVSMILGATNNIIQNNRIGVGTDGVAPLPNAGHGLLFFDGPTSNIVEDNIISGNGGYGISLARNAGSAPVNGTRIRRNVIGLDAAGNLIRHSPEDWIGNDLVNFGPRIRGNMQGGINLEGAPGTIVGEAGLANTVSGNTFHGIRLTGTFSTPPEIRFNRIGTDPTGLLPRGNTNAGIYVDGANDFTIGGTDASGNLVSGNLSDGIEIFSGHNVNVFSNVIGLAADGVTAIGNGRLQVEGDFGCCHAGVTVDPDNSGIRIGGVGGLGNTISGNHTGVWVGASNATRIEGNRIGVAHTTADIVANAGDAGIALYNSIAPEVRGNTVAGSTGLAGIFVYDASDAIIESNTIRNQANAGIIVALAGGGHRIALNSIFDNGGLGIDLNWDGVTANDSGDADTGTNGLQNFPILSNAANAASGFQIDVDTTGFAAGSFIVNFYSTPSCDASGFGEGQTFIGQATLGANTIQTVVLGGVLPPGHAVTATAQAANGDTSEFSACVVVDPSVTLTPNPFTIVTNTSAPMTVTLSHPAGAGGQTVTFVSNDPVATVQPSISIAEGTTTGTVTVSTGTSAGSAMITATAAGFDGGIADVNVALRSMTLTAPSTLIGVGRTLTGTITLADPAPIGGLTVDLVSSNTNFVTVSPATVNIAQGATTGTFTIEGIAVGASIITGSATGASVATLNMTATISSLISLGTAPVVAPGQNVGLAVSLGVDAPPGGVTISFVSSDENVATISPSVFIPEGLRIPAANPQVTGIAPGTATLTATAAGFAPDSKSVSVTLTLSFTPASNFSVIAGRTSNITLNLSAPAPAGGLTLTTSTDNTTFATVPPTAIVDAGQTSVAVPVTGVAVGNTIIRASGTGIAEASASVRVDPTPGIGIADAIIGQDLQVQVAGTLGLPAQAGGVVVTITSLDPSRVLLATAANAAGSPSITRTVAAGTNGIPAFWIQALAGTGTAEIEATASGYTADTSTITMQPSGFILNMSNFATNTLAANTTLRVDAARLSPATLSFLQPQPLRGGLTVNVTVTSSTPAVGTIVGSPVTFQGGDATLFAPAFDPATVGSTTIAVTAPDGFDTPSNLQSIVATVNDPTISLGDLTIGKDLQASLSGSIAAAAPPGDLVVTITSLDPSRVLLANSSTSPGSTSINVSVTAGTFSIPTFFVHALMDTGTAQLQATAPGYAPDTSLITLQPSGFVLNMGSFTTNTFAANATLRIDAGRLNPSTLAFVTSQSVRGGLTVNVPVTSSDTGVGTIVGSPASFAGSESINFDTAFDPAGSGQTTISLTTPDGFATPSNLQSITATVTAPGITIANVVVGRDLQVGAVVSLASPPPAPVTVTVTSNNGAVATITRDGTLEGGASVTFTNVTSTNVGTIFVQGRSLGATTLTVSAAGYDDGTSNVTVDPSGFILNVGNFTTNTFAPDVTLRVDAARLNPSTLAYVTSQPLRGGLTVSVPVTSSDTNVGAIVGSPAGFEAGVAFNFATAFNPATAGVTTISIGTPAGFSTPSNAQSIVATVTAPDITIASAIVGRDLQSAVSILLDAAPPSPVTVTVTSNNGTIASITRDGTIAGGPSLTFTNVTTTSVGTFFVQGRTLGSTTITVQASGYNDGTSHITVVPSGFVLNMGDLTTTASAANVTLRVDAGRLDPSTLNFVTTQQLRGGLTVNVPVSSSNSAVGTIVGSPAVFTGGNSLNFGTALDPVAPGATTISVTAPAGFHTPSNLQSIAATVNP